MNDILELATSTQELSIESPISEYHTDSEPSIAVIASSIY